MTSRCARALPVLLSLVLAGGLASPSYADSTPDPSPTPTPTPGQTATSTPSPGTTASSATAPTTPAPAAETTAPADPPRLTLAGGGRVRLDRSATLTATLRDAQGAALAGREVVLQRRTGTTWSDVVTLTTAADGAARTAVQPAASPTAYRAVLGEDRTVASDEKDVQTVTGYTVPTRTTLTGPTSVVDERSVRLGVTVQTTDDATRVPARIALQRRLGSGAWSTIGSVPLAGGAGSVVLRPRSTATYRAVAGAGRFWTASTSGVLGVRVTPPGTVVRLPSGSPQPRGMAAQPRSTTAGAGIVVSRLSDAQWRRMSGVSWHRGCPVGRAGLRSIELNYWAFDGYRRRGRLVVNAHAVGKYSAAFQRLYDARVPIRRVYPTETFGYSRASHGANDRLAMRSDNTSAFNCRWVTGRPHVASPHSTGYAIDINTFENPYHTSAGWLPNTWWPRRAFGLIAWRTQSATVVAIMRRSGFSWTYGVADSQHFDVRR